MNFSYNPLLVTLSVLVAVQASYVGLSLAQHIPSAVALNRRLLLVGAAMSLAIGIWGMHFIGMLAIKTTFMLDYDVLPTLISFLVCVLVTGAAIYLASLRAPQMLIIAAFVMGLGIAAMHYIGMFAVHSRADMSHQPRFILASIVIAISASWLALYLAFAADKRPSLLLCSAVLGCAISGMHYTAMAGTSLHQMQMMPIAAPPSISGDFLAAIVSIVAFSVSALFMLTLIPGRPVEPSKDSKWSSVELVPSPFVIRQAGQDMPQDAVTARANYAHPPPNITLPFEKSGHCFHIEIDEIVSVHANAHYTYIFNGREDLFCPLSITEINAKLPQKFFRTHRSYIVNLAHVTLVKKRLDAGVAELNSPMRRNVPVSRNRMVLLRGELAAFQATQN